MANLVCLTIFNRDKVISPPRENFDLSLSEMLCGDHVFARPFPIMQMKLAFYAPHNSCLITKKCSNYTRLSK